MKSLPLLSALLFLTLGIASSADDVQIIADRVSQDVEEDSVEYPRPAGPLTTLLDEENEIGKSVNDVPGLTEDMVSKALSKARREVLNEERKVERDTTIKAHGYTHQSAHYRNRYHPGLESTRKRALIMEKTLMKVADSLGMKTARDKRSLYGVTSFHVSRMSCSGKARPLCSTHAPFRTADGTCNNLHRPNMGSANTPFVRLKGAEQVYADGISAPRVSISGHKLPNARLVTSTLFEDQDVPSLRLSHLNMVWGQWVDHDTTLGAQPRIMCRGRCGDRDGECVGIKIPLEDPHFPYINVYCIPLKRDVPSVPQWCGQMKPREQVNTLTSYIDASQVYGPNLRVQRGGRALNPDLGLVKEKPNPAGPGLRGLMPAVNMMNSTCRTPDRFYMPCFRSGDGRTNENPGLAAMHHVFAREHNRLAKILRYLNPHWRGEQTYQVARKIIGAMNQHIIYNEYLPEILDPNTRAYFGLNLHKHGFADGYNANINPAIINSFAAAAFRFGHSQIRNTMSRIGKHMYRYFDMDTSDNNNPEPLYDISNGGIDSILRGLAYDPAQKVDGFFAKAVTTGLKRNENDVSDLPAINIQRGREHGVPGYNTFRKACGLRPLKSMKDFETIMPGRSVVKLNYLYKHPDDVDLFVGGILERNLPGGAVGPTFSCILAEQFKNLRYGDRFWYERNDPTIGFSLPQLNELRKVSLARILCDSSDAIERLPRWVLSTQSHDISCRSLPKMDLSYWKENIYH